MVSGGMFRIGAEQHKYVAIHPVVNGHQRRGEEADAKAGKPQPLTLIKRRDAGTGEQNGRSGRDDRLHKNSQSQQQRAEKGNGVDRQSDCEDGKRQRKKLAPS